MQQEAKESRTKKSPLEQTWYLVVLIVLTSAIVGCFVLVFVKGLKIPTGLYTTIGTIMPMWYMRHAAKKKSANKNVEQSNEEARKE